MASAAGRQATPSPTLRNHWRLSLVRTRALASCLQGYWGTLCRPIDRWTIGAATWGGWGSGCDGHRPSVAIWLSPAGDFRGLWRRLDWFCAKGGGHRSPELPRRSRGSATAISVGQAARWPRPAQPCIGDRLSAGRSRGRVSAEARWPARQSRTWATINGPRRTRPALRR